MINSSRGFAPQPARSRSAQRISRLLAGAAMLAPLAIMAAPGQALAANECGPAAPGGTVTCAPGSYPQIVYNDNLGVTINLPAGVTTTTGGVFVGNGSGNVSIVSDPSNTLAGTGGNTALGVSITNGSISLSAGTTTNSGVTNPNMFAITGGGAINITSNSATSTGTGASSLAILAQDTGVGSITINSGTATNSGPVSTIAAIAANGAVSVTSQSAIATGTTNAFAILANAAQGATTVNSGLASSAVGAVSSTANAGTVTIVSDDARKTGAGAGLAIFGSGSTGASITSRTATNSGAMTVNATTPTSSNFAIAIDATSNAGRAAITSGAVQTTGAGGIGIVGIGRDGVTINSTSVTTTGATFTNPNSGTTFGSTGISGNSAQGDVVINSGSVSTAADFSPAIFTRAPAGAITITSGSATVTGRGSDALDARALKDITITSGNASTSGAVTAFVSVNGADPGVNVAEPRAITAVSLQGAVSITTTGTSATTGAGAQAIYGEGKTGVTIKAATTTTSGASVTVSGDFYQADAITAVSDGPIVIDSGTVSTAGLDAAGIQAAAATFGGTTGSIKITSANVRTTGDDASGIVAKGGTGAVAITSGVVKTDGQYSHGIAALTTSGAVNIVSADARTLGTLYNPDVTDYNASFAPTYGTGPGPQLVASNAISAATTTGAITINSGIAQAAGDRANAIYAISTNGGAVSITSETASTTGAGAASIVASSVTGVTVNSTNASSSGQSLFGAPAGAIFARTSAGNTVVTSGVATSSGVALATINAGATGGATTVTSTDSRATGAGADAIFAIGQNGVTVTSGFASSTGGSFFITQNGTTSVGAGILALSSAGAANVTSTTVQASGAGGLGLVANGATGATVNSGAVTTTGGIFTGGGVNYTSTGIASTVTAGDSTITSGTVSTQGADAPGIFAYTPAGKITINSGSVSTVGNGSAGIYAYGRDNISITSANAASAGGALTLLVNGGIPGLTTTQADAISATSLNGAVAITSGAASASGAGSHAIWEIAKTGATLTVTGATSAAAAGIDAVHVESQSGPVTATINGAITGTNGYGAHVLTTTGPGAVTVTVGAGGSVTGRDGGLEVDGDTGLVTVNNAGTIRSTGATLSGASQSALDIGGAAGAVVNNSGAIIAGLTDPTLQGTAISFSSAAVNDTLNLFTGSRIVGTVNTGAGFDTVNLAGTINTATAQQTFGAIFNAEALNVNSGLWSLTSGYTTNATTIAAGAALQIDDIAGQAASLTTGTLVDNGGFIYNTVNSRTYAGVVSGAGSLTKIGTGALTLSGAQTYTGGSIVSGGSLIVTGSLASGATVNAGGVLQIGAAGTTGSVTGPIVDNGTVIFDRTDDFSVGGAFSGSGAIIKRNANAVTLSGPYSFTGTTSILGGQLNISQLASTGGLVVNGGTVNLGTGTQTVASLNGTTGTVVVPTGGTLDVDNGTFGGSLTGGGGLLINGSGTVNLTGTNTYTGPTTVTGGLLDVNGSITSPVTVTGTGALGGNGTVAAAVTIGSGGGLTPGNSPGTLNVVGNFTFAAGSTYVLETVANGVSDKLNVTGQVIIQPGATVRVSPTDAVSAYARLTNYANVVAATGGVSGTFSTVTSTLAFLTPHLTYTANAVNLALTRNDITFASLAQNANQAAVGSAIEAGGFGTPLYTALVVQDAVGSRAGYNLLSGESLGGVGTALIGQSHVVRQALTDRLSADEDGGAFWGKAIGARSHADDTPASASIDNKMGGLMIGADHALGGAWRGGAAIGYLDNNIDAKRQATSADARSTLLSVYGGGSAGPLGIRLSAGYGFHNIKTSRAIAFTGFSDTARASYKAKAAEVSGEVAYKLMDVGAVRVEPFASLTWNQLDTDAFTEAGGAAALRIAKQTRSVTFGRIGLRASTKLGDDLQLTGSANILATSGDVEAVSRAAFVGTGQAFATKGASLGDHAGEIGVSLSGGFAGKGRVNLSYQGVFGSDYTSNTLDAGISWKF